MKLKTLALTVILLAALSGGLWWKSRPPAPVAPPPASPVGKPLLEQAAAEKAAELEISEENGANTVIVRKETSGWRVPSFHQLPADFEKLSRLITSLNEAKVEREVSKEKGTLARLELGKNKLHLKDTAGGTILGLETGKTSQNGGVFVKLDKQEAAFLVNQSLWLDARPDNWAQKNPLTIKADNVVELTIPCTAADEAPLMLKKEKDQKEFKMDGLSENQSVKQTEVTRILNNLLNARFQEVKTETAAPDVVAARTNAYTAKIKTDAGLEVTMLIGRQPAQPLPPTPPPAPAAPVESEAPGVELLNPPEESATGETADTPADQPATPEPPKMSNPGPVYIAYSFSDSAHPFAGVSDRLALKFADYIYTSLPANRAALIEIKATPPAPPPTAAASSEAISIPPTTPAPQDSSAMTPTSSDSGSAAPASPTVTSISLPMQTHTSSTGKIEAVTPPIKVTADGKVEILTEPYHLEPTATPSQDASQDTPAPTKP